MTPEQTVRAAQRVNEFLKDPAIGEAFARMERRFYEEFIAAESAEQRVRAWAKASMLKTFENEVRSILDAGEGEVLKAAKATKASRTTQE